MNTSCSEVVAYKKLTFLDIVIIAVCLFTAAAVFPFIHSHSPNTVVVYRIDTKIAEYPLYKDKKFKISGVDGPMVIEIKNKHVSVKRSSCKRQICVHTHPISRPGSQIICAPNKVIVMIKSNKKGNDVDALAR